MKGNLKSFDSVEKSAATNWNLPTLAHFNPFSKKKSQSKFGSSCNDRKNDRKLENNLATESIKRSKKLCKIFYWKFVVLSVLFAISLYSTAILWFTTIYQDEVTKILTLRNGSTLFEIWKNPPLKPLLCVHIFNYTNTEEYFSEENKINKNIKLKVKDIGPYCFREEIERTNMVFSSNGTELTFKEIRRHTFVAESSRGSLNDTVIVPNVLIISMFKAIKESLALVSFTGVMALKMAGASVITKLEVNDFLFGYEDSIFSTARQMSMLVNSDSDKIPKKFGILMMRTGLSEDKITVGTGVGRWDDMGQVMKFNDISQFDVWQSDACNRVAGGDGVLFNRSSSQNRQDVYLFHKDSCTTVSLTYASSVDIGYGIMAYRYKLRSDMFDYSLQENKCFCTVSDSCAYSGILDASSCPTMEGAPMVMSRPHFLDSKANLDHNNEEIIEGFEPNINKHDFEIDVYPSLGIIVKTLLGVQLNIRISNDDGYFDPIEDKTILPLAWLSMTSDKVPEDMLMLLFHLTYTIKYMEIALKWIFLIFTILVAFILFKILLGKFSPKNQLILISKKRKANKDLTTSVYVS